MLAELTVEVELRPQGVCRHISADFRLLRSFRDVQCQSFPHRVILCSIVHHVSYGVRLSTEKLAALARRILCLETNVEVQTLHQLEVQSCLHSVILVATVETLFLAIDNGVERLVHQSDSLQSFQFVVRFIFRKIHRISILIAQHRIGRVVAVDVCKLSHSGVSLVVCKATGDTDVGFQPFEKEDVVSQRETITFRRLVARVVTVAVVVEGKHVSVFRITARDA